MWLFTSGYSCEQVADLTSLENNSSVQNLYRAYLEIVCNHQEHANEILRVGGEKIHCEADEVCLRATAVEMPDGEVKIEWMRYIGLLKRGSSRIYLEALPLRYTKGSGQGGGGALSVEELEAVLQVECPEGPRLLPGNVLHTDSAKAYRKCGPMRWLGPGAHHDDSFAEKCARFRWTHTCVVHKRKVGERLRYAPTRVITHADGTVEEYKTGTQICDGFW